MEDMYGQQYGQQQHPFSSSSSLYSASSSTPQPRLDYFPIDDLLDLSNDQIFSNSSSADSHPHSSYFPPPPPPPPAAADFSNALGLCLPSEDVAELEWLSRFVDDSFADFPPQPQLMPQLPSNNEKSFISTTNSKPVYRDERHADGIMRRCTHCASEKTPQWRTGPLGPKTLCNACGVRYKSGRLVPEYRPAASPTFVLTQHSNSHRKVMELRRQKEVVNSPSPSQQQTEEDEQQQQRRFYLHSNGFQVC